MYGSSVMYGTCWHDISVLIGQLLELKMNAWTFARWKWRIKKTNENSFVCAQKIFVHSGSISCHLAVSCHWKENWNECYMWVSEWYEQTVFDVSQTENIHGVWNHYAIIFWVFVHTSRILKPCIKQPNVNDSFHYERRVWNRRLQADRWIATQRVWKNKFDRI